MTPRVSKTQRDRLGELDRAATPRPWKTLDGQKPFDHTVVSPPGDAELGNWMVAERVRWEQDRNLISEARNLLPDLLADIDDMAAENATLKAALAKAREALSLFASRAAPYEPNRYSDDTAIGGTSLGSLRRAASALTAIDAALTTEPGAARSQSCDDCVLTNLTELRTQADDVGAAIAAEREACARVADEYEQCATIIGDEIAALIRARTKPDRARDGEREDGR